MSELQALKKDINKRFEDYFQVKPQFVAAAPGRINIIGEHTDYNYGLSMPAAINRWVIISFSLREDYEVKIFSESFASKLEFELGVDITPKESWQKYIWGCIMTFLKYEKIDQGFNAYIWGNVPLGSGVSSSAAIEVAMMNVLRTAYKAKFNDTVLVKACQQVEHQYLKVNSGLLDQYASQFSRVGNLMILDFQAMSHEYANAEMDDYIWVLANTKVKRELASSKYSERVEETLQSLDILKKQDSDIRGFRDIKFEHLDLLEKPVLKKRISHYVSENKRVLDAVQCLKKKDLKSLGKLLVASHKSLQNDYEVSCPELDFLVDEAIKVNGCLGARMMGGGFGGCTINLVKKDALKDFTKHLTNAYKMKFNIQTEISDYQLVEGARCDVIPK